MRTVLNLILMATAFFIVACGGNPEEDMQGTWQIDMDAIKNAKEYKSISAADQATMLRTAKGMTMTIKGKEMKIELLVQGKKVSHSATFVVKKREGNKLTIERTMNGEKEVGDFYVNGDSLKFKTDDEFVIFKRQ